MHTPRWLRAAVPPVMLVATFCTGCSSSSTTSVILHPPYFTSRDGFLQYRLPAGWFDATADSQSTGQTIWLLRNDYSSTIAASEVHVDPDAREDLHVAGIMHLARLTMAMAAGGKPYILERPPESVMINGVQGCRYEMTTPSTNDVLRVIVVDTGTRIYMVTALLSGEAKHGLRDEVFPVQDAFLNSLRW